MATVIPSLKINSIDFKPITFQSTEYKAAQPNEQLMPHSLQVQKAITKEALSNIDAIDTVFSTIRQNLDVSEHQWLDNRAQQIRERIDEQAALGNTETVIRFAMDEARNLKRDTELADKMSVHQKRQKAIQEVKNDNQYGNLTKRKFAAINNYEFKGDSEWKPKWNPVKEYTPQEIIDIAASRTAADAGGYNNSSKKDQLLDSTNKPTEKLSDAIRTTGSVTKGRGNQYNRKLKEDMQQTMADLLLQPEYYNGLKQNLESTLWAYTEAMKKANDLSNSEEDREMYLKEANDYAKGLKDENGIIPSYSDSKGVTEKDFEKWIQGHLTPMFKNMEYNNVHTSRSDSNDIDPNYLARQNELWQDQRYKPSERVETTGKPSLVKYPNTIDSDDELTPADIIDAEFDLK